jgi:MFS family permease
MTTNARLFTRTTAVLAAALTTAVFAQDARADEVSPKGKGIVGGALLGAEVVTITESIIGVKDGLYYAIGGGLGAVGGGIGGYFVEQNSSDGRVPMYMLAGGMALVIPAVVLMLNATRYKPSEEATEDKAPTGPAANPGQPGGSSVLGTEPAAPPPTPPPSGGGATTPPPGGTTPPPPPPQSLLDVRLTPQAGTLRFGVPVPEVRQLYSIREQKELGVPQGAMLKMPVVHVTF